jgi:hypothetical protein
MRVEAAVSSHGGGLSDAGVGDGGLGGVTVEEATALDRVTRRSGVPLRRPQANRVKRKPRACARHVGGEVVRMSEKERGVYN